MATKRNAAGDELGTITVYLPRERAKEIRIQAFQADIKSVSKLGAHLFELWMESQAVGRPLVVDGVESARNGLPSDQVAQLERANVILKGLLDSIQILPNKDD